MTFNDIVDWATILGGISAIISVIITLMLRNDVKNISNKIQINNKKLSNIKQSADKNKRSKIYQRNG